MVTSFTPRLSLTRMRCGNDGNRKCRHAVLFNILEQLVSRTDIPELDLLETADNGVGLLLNFAVEIRVGLAGGKINRG